MKKKKQKQVSALTYPKYAKFIDARDRAAEKMLGNFRLEQSDILRKYFKKILDAVAKFILHSSKNVKLLDAQIENILVPAISELTSVTQDLKRLTFTLALVSEAEAIGRITGKAKYDVQRDLVSRYLSRPSLLGRHTRDSVALYLDRLRRDVVDALQQASIRKAPDGTPLNSPRDIFQAVIKVFPNVKRQRVVHELSKIKESDKKKSDDDEVNEIATGSVDDNDWNQIVDAYTTGYIPEYRGPDYQINPNEPGWPADEKVYATDIEREMTDDFVKAVRDGQVEAANQNGISEFIWLAILDDKTCEDCCQPRDGLTTSEIQEGIDSGELDECDALCPPAHVACRCRLAPMVDSDQEPVTVDTEGFDDWAAS